MRLYTITTNKQSSIYYAILSVLCVPITTLKACIFLANENINKSTKNDWLTLIQVVNITTIATNRVF